MAIDLATLANFVIGGGFASIMVALIGGFFSRSTRKGDYAHRIVEASGAYADRADKRVQQLEQRDARNELIIDRLKHKIWKVTDLLRQALPYVRACGDDALAGRITTVLEAGTAQADPPADGGGG